MNRDGLPMVLIVEDEPKIARLMIDYLVQADYTTHWIDDGLSVVSWVKQHQPNLVLLDLMLAGQRRHEHLPRAPCLLGGADYHGHRPGG